MGSLKEQHNKLLAEMPDGATHDEATCSFCSTEVPVETDPEGGDMKTYTEDEFTAAVQEAVAPIQAAADAKVAEIQASLDALTAASEQSEVDSAIAEVQAKLDVAEAKAAAAEKTLADTVSYLESAVAAEAEAARLETVKTERRDAIKAVAAFGDEYIDANIDRWVALSDEAFEATLEDLRAVASVTPATEGEPEVEGEAAAETAMETVRTERSTTSAAAAVFSARNRGIDVRELNI
jgi:hypothetical protein